MAFDPIYPTPPNTWLPATTSSDWERPCNDLPDPTLQPLCQQSAIEFPPTYEGVPPSGHGPFPLVLFSTGWSTGAVTYSFFAQRLASHGFVVAVAQHSRDRYRTWDPLDPFHVAMFNRPRDVVFMLDALLARNGDTGSVLHNSMRPDLVAAAGHSLGGYATLTLAAGDDEVCVGTTFDTNPLPMPCNPIVDQGGNPIPTLPDPRIRALVTLDGVNRTHHFSELARIAVPSMSIGQSFDAPGWSTFLPARQHAAISGHPNYRVDVVNALHQSFTVSCTGVWVAYRYGFANRNAVITQMNQPWCSAALPQGEANRLAATYAIAFLKTNLAGETGYQHILTPGYALTREDNIQFFVTEPKNATALGEDPTTFPYFPYQRGGVIFHADKESETPAIDALEP